MRDRVYAPEDKRWIFNKLRKSNDNPEGFFETNKDIFVFAATIGFNQNKAFEVSKRGVEIPFHIFDKDNKDFIDTIALANTLDDSLTVGDVNMLSWQDDDIVEKKLTIIEEFANGGLEILNQELFQNNTTIHDNLLQLINNELKDEHDNKDIGNLEDLVDLI